MMPISRLRVALAAALFVASAAPHLVRAQAPSADLVLRNGRIATMDSARPSAQALAARDGRIVIVGSDADVAPLIGASTRVIDLHGAFAAPGFIESHGHFMGLGESLMELDLTKAHTWDDIVAMVRKAAATAKPGEWIVGRGWHQEKWDRAPQPNVHGLPYNTTLSAASPRNPVYLEHASGHGAIVNALAMKLAGIGPNTPNPPGGEIVRDDKGVAIGTLQDRAAGLVGRVMAEADAKLTPAEREARAERQVQLAAQDAIRKGITSFQDQGESFETLAFYRKLADEGKLPIRLYAMVGSRDLDELARQLPLFRTIDYADHYLTIRSIGEVTADGALGTHTAWFLQPYDDVPGATGLNVTPMSKIAAIAKLALANDYQVAVHAIGDRANHETLDLFDSVFKANPGARDLRWRIEHAQHLEASDIPRFGQLGVIASMQGIHACSDGPYVVKRLGETRARVGAYVWQSLLKTGAVIANGTDVPVEDEDPIPNFHCSVTRQLKDGSTFHPAQAMSREQALRSYTRDAAYAAFEENEKGSLAPGKLADIVVLSRDILSVPADSVPSTRVEYTIIGGKVAYSAGMKGMQRR